MGRTACTQPQCLYKGTLYLYGSINNEASRITYFSLACEIYSQRLSYVANILWSYNNLNVSQGK